MSNLHPPTQICSGRIDPNEPDKPRVLLTNPITERGSVHSTDQTAKGKPEWIFPRCPASMPYMLGCSLIITEHDEQNKPHPEDCSIFNRDLLGDGDDEEYTFIVRVHTEGRIKQILEQNYFHKECTHGIVVVVPCNPMIAIMLGAQERDDPTMMEVMVRKPLDATLVDFLAREEESIRQALGRQQGGR